MIHHPLVTYTADLHGLTAAQLIGPSRRREVFVARAVACWMLDRRGLGQAHIGRLLGNRDHSTVASAIERINGDGALRKHALQCEALLTEMTQASAYLLRSSAS